jgi:cell division septation protein DedD
MPVLVLALAAQVAATTIATVAHAQASGTTVTVNLDEQIGRARLLVESGSGRAGRLLLDSLIQQASVGTPALGELLYWRGLLSESGADAERDWRRLLLEVPMSPRAEDALLRLAQLEQLRGNPGQSRGFLEQLVREYREPASQARAHYWLARAWFDENDRARACGALAVVRRDAPSSAVELRTQAESLQSQCRGVTAVSPISEAVATGGGVAGGAAAVRDSLARETAARDAAARDAAARDAAARDAAARDAARRDSIAAAQRDAAAAATRDSIAAAARAAAASATTTPPASRSSTSARPAGARFSVQLAAYARLDQAEALVRTLAARDIDARVDGTTQPFRVRTGYFTTRASAAARLAELKRQGHDGFVAELTP